MAFSLGEYQDIFLEEADDQLQELNKNLLEMEQNPDDEDTINNIFRAAHSLKSSAAFVGLNDLSELAHKMENLLQGVRDKTMRITPEIIDLLFKSFDYINSVIDQVSQGQEPDIDLNGIIQDIYDIQEQVGGAEEEAPPEESTSQEETTEKLEKITFSIHEKRHLKRGLDEGLSCYEMAIYIEPDAPMKWVKAQLILNNLKNLAQIVKTIPDEENLTDEKIKNILRVIILTEEELNEVRSSCNVDLVTRIDVLQINLQKRDNKFVLRYGERETISEEEVQSPDVPEEKIEEETPTVSEAVSPAPVEESETASLQPAEDDHDAPAHKGARRDVSARAGSPSLRTVKVSVDKLDDLLNNVGELVIANSGFFRLYEDLKKQKLSKKIGNDFKNRIETMARIAKDLQSGIMKTRMVPIGQVFSRFHRLTRDLSKEMNKSVQLVTKGEDTELDKKVIDVIGEPLMHMVRNSVDHAIESPDERTKLNKNETGTITLSAHQGGNQIFVEVVDDGRGLDIEQIKRKAIERDLVTPDQLATMEEVEIYNFIFNPGFSTAKKVTDVSGRGVGMNVVKEVVEEMGGSISIESEKGMGTRFIMAFPLTLAIIPAIMVKVAIETYAIPLTDVIETVNIDKKDITTIEGHEVINLRGEILSLVRLNNFVGIRSRNTNEEDIPVVVVGYSNRKIGLIVDELEGKLEIVIKSLETNYKTVEGLAGASILGDGSIALILDVASMITKVITEQERLSQEEKEEMIRLQEAQFDEVEEESRQYAELSNVQHEIEEGSMDLSEVEEETVDNIYKLKESDAPEQKEEAPKAVPEISEQNDEAQPDALVSEKESEALSSEELPPSVQEEMSEEESDSEKSAEPDETADESVVAEDSTVEDESDSLNDQDAAVSPSIEIEENDVQDLSEESVPAEDMQVVSGESENTEEAVEEEEIDPLRDEDLDDAEIKHSAEDITDMLRPVESESKPVAGAEKETDPKVHEALATFREELKSNIQSNTQGGEPDDHIRKVLKLNQDDLDKIKILANVGVTQAADSLSKIIGVRIDMAIPDVRLIPAEKILSYIGDESDIYMSVNMDIVGDVDGSVVFSIPDDSGYQLIDDLYNLESGATKQIDDDGESAIKEITNIVGSSVINAISERTGLSILTDVPYFTHDTVESIKGKVLAAYNLKRDYALTMDTEFYYEDDRVMGRLLVIPKTSSLRRLVDNLRENG